MEACIESDIRETVSRTAPLRATRRELLRARRLLLRKQSWVSVRNSIIARKRSMNHVQSRTRNAPAQPAAAPRTNSI